jgi:hypothetical protein
VTLRRADELLRGKLAPDVPVFVKIDVEGAELGVLKGMPELMRRPHTRFYVELGDGHSERFGNRAAVVFELFHSFGYRAHLARLSPLHLGIRLEAIAGPIDKAVYDVLFVKSP